ncbi:MAG TPA: indole-3-glycerol-phosphate synthase, partial [Candidatus Saccharimonadales bacterium]|nr:indole-3-glycerol-phosphate synthase [Candidatus Saccharimonadales bacterium]
LAGLGKAEESSFYDALKVESPHPTIIAEVKKASPSAGVLRENFSLEEINGAYQSAVNVVAISVITERDHFKGSEDFLTYFAKHNMRKKPLLRKDFLFEPYQILESKLLGAHAYLLIASLFDKKELSELVALGLSIGIEPLIEVHAQEELDMALATKARCIGVNARDLKTFKVDLDKHELLKQLDGSYARVAESGIRNLRYLMSLSEFCDAALIGTELVAPKHITAALEALA